MVAGTPAQQTRAAIAASTVSSLLTPETTLASVGGIQLPAPLAICTRSGGAMTSIRTAPVTAPPVLRISAQMPAPSKAPAVPANDDAASSRIMSPVEIRNT